MLIFFLLNPFFMSVYLLGVFNELDAKIFKWVLLRSTLISLCVFILFAWAGDQIFTEVLHARFSSFLIFGGIVFLLIGIGFVFKGHDALTSWRGDPELVTGSIAMPFMIGPGTVMASVMAGTRLDFPQAAASIIVSVGASSICLYFLKILYDHVRSKSEKLIQRYVVVTGRVMALVIGTFSIEMIFQGIELWLKGLEKTGF